jgi:hypothetical protein
MASAPVTVQRMPDGRYRQSAQVNGDEAHRAEKPFPVEIIPSALVAGLLPDAAGG